VTGAHLWDLLMSLGRRGLPPRLLCILLLVSQSAVPLVGEFGGCDAG
jgi:hypothetical protein